MCDTPRVQGILIPHTRLSPQALDGVIHEFVTRDGTDYGETEVPLETMMHRVKQQLDRGSAVLVFDPDSQSCTILSSDHPAVRALKA